MNAAIRSPRLTPSERNRAATLATCARSSGHVSWLRSLRSFANTIAVPWPWCSSKFAAKLSFAPPNHLAPGIRAASRSTPSCGAAALISQNCQTASQNSAGDATLQS
jgi:hypothetical protein